MKPFDDIAQALMEVMEEDELARLRAHQVLAVDCQSPDSVW